MSYSIYEHKEATRFRKKHNKDKKNYWNVYSGKLYLSIWIYSFFFIFNF